MILSWEDGVTAAKENRRNAILSILEQSGMTSVEDLRLRFDVSGMTIRRDLDALEGAGSLQRIRGGALANKAPDSAPTPEGPDVLIINPMDVRMARMIVQDFSQKQIPVLAESIPMAGIRSVVAIDSFHSGIMLGEWVGHYAIDRMDGAARVLFIGVQAFVNTAERAQGFFEGLKRVIPQPDFAMLINGLGQRIEARQVVSAALSIHPDVNIIIGVNDQSALGALDAIRELNLSLDDRLVGTFGLEGAAGKDLLMRDCPHAVGIAMFPQFIGRVCIDAAIKAYNKLDLPEHIVTPTVVVTRETLPDYYRSTPDGWKIRWEEIRRLPVENWRPDATLLEPLSGYRMPRRIDFLRYLHDEYYDQLVTGLAERGIELGIDVRVTDASANLIASIDQARRDIGMAAAGLVNPGETVILDGGSTIGCMAQELAKRTDQRFTVISHSAPVIEALKTAEHVTLVGIGGMLHRGSQCFLGTQAEIAFDGLRADKAFLGASGVSVEGGITTAYIAEAEVKRRIIRAAKEVIVLADSMKLGEVSVVRIAGLNVCQRLVTDDQITSHDRLAFAQAGVETIVASIQARER